MVRKHCGAYPLVVGQMVFFQPDYTCATGLLAAMLEGEPLTITKLVGDLATLRTSEGHITPQISTSSLVGWLLIGRDSASDKLVY